MASVNVERFVDYLLERLGDDLRSVGWHADGEFEVVHAREDVLDEYTEEEVEQVFRDLGIESIEKGLLEDLYEHGRLNCTVRCFEDAIEMHFVVDRGKGIAVAMEPAAFVAHETFIGECMRRVGTTSGADEGDGERSEQCTSGERK
jgi:hypothetical protein